MRTICLFLFLLFFSSTANANVRQGTQTNSNTPPQQIIVPTPLSPTIPQDAMYALGVQGGKIDDMSKRLDVVDQNINEIKTDVDHLDVYASILGLIFGLIVAPLIFEGIRRWVFKASASH